MVLFESLKIQLMFYFGIVDRTSSTQEHHAHADLSRMSQSRMNCTDKSGAGTMPKISIKISDRRVFQDKDLIFMILSNVRTTIPNSNLLRARFVFASRSRKAFVVFP